MSDYWQKQIDALDAKNGTSSKATSSNSANSSDYWQQQITTLEKKNQKKKKYTADIAPYHSDVAERVKARATVSSQKKKDEKKKKWFEKGLFEDGYDFGDVSKTILGTAADVVEDLGAGIAEMPEKIVDATAMIAPYYAQSQLNQAAYSTMNKDLLKSAKEYDLAEEKKKAGEFVKKDLYDGKAVAQSILNPVTDSASAMIGQEFETASVLGEKADSIVESGGQLLATMGLQAVGVPWFVTTGVTSFGAESENALNQGATHEEAMGSAAISAAAEVLTEKISGGIKFGGKTLDDALTKTLARRISNKLGRTLARLGVDAAGEGFEEVISQVASNLGSSLYRLDEESMKEILVSEQAFEEYLDSFFGGVLLGGVSSGFRAIDSTLRGEDFAPSLPVKDQNIAPINQEVIQAEGKPEVAEVRPDVAEVQPEAAEKPKPRVLYTGSPNTDIQQFKVGAGARETGDRYGRGIYLTTNEATAKNYAGETGRVYQTSADGLNIFNLNDKITPQMKENLVSGLRETDPQYRNSVLRNFRTEKVFDDFESAEAFLDQQEAIWKEQDGIYDANKPVADVDDATGKAVIEFTDFQNWENSIGDLTGSQLYDALKSLSTDDFSSFITANGFDGIAFDEDADNQQYVIYRNEDRLPIDVDATVAENSTVEQKTQLTAENSIVPTEPGVQVGEKNAPTVSEMESVDASAELGKLYDERQVLEDTISSLVAAEDLGENYIVLCERLAEVDQKISAYKDMVTNLEPTDTVVPVPTPEPDAPYWFSEEIAKVVEELSLQDTNDPKYGKMDAFEIRGYVIQRRSLKDGKRWHYSIISPDGTSRYNIVEADKNAFYGDVAEKLESIMRIDFSDDFEQFKPGAFAADGPVRVVSTEDGDYLKTDQFTEEKKPPQSRAKILTEMPKQKPKAQEKKTDSLNVDNETTDGKKSPLKWFEENIMDHGFWVEKLSKKTKNRELEAKWDGIRRVRSAANYLIGKGGNGVKSLKSMMETVEKAGLTQDFYNYLGHYRNIDGMTLETRYNTYNKGVWGDVSAAESQFEVDRLEKLHPEFKEWAENVWAYNTHLRNEMVRGGLISQKLADRLAEMYPHYVPIRRVGKDGTIEVESTNHVGVNSPLKSATGGNANIMPLFNTMAERTMEVYKAVAMNQFGLELYKTLYPGRLNVNTSIAPDFSSVGMATEDVDVDYSIDGFDPREELLQSGKPGSLPTFSFFIDGERHTMDINSEMYTSLKPTSDLLSMNIPVVSQMNTLRRNLITTYNLWFGLSNAVKDTQDVLINSQHPLKTYATYGKAIGEMVSKGKFYQEYVANGGEHCTYFDTQESSFDAKKGVLDYVENTIGLKQIIALNNYIEMLPRLSEFIASREEGRSVAVSMLDAARVTTNFGAGGKVTKFLDRNGVTFLNSSVQGFVQQARNVAEAKQNGLKGFASLAARYLAAGLPAVLLNRALWEDDEEYQALPDYITNNYYIPFKYGDGQFVRIPKGRTAAVIQNAIEQVGRMSSGDDEADWNEFFKLFIENIAPNNPLTDNILAPIIQTATNTTWYGEDIIPYRLKDLPASEQFDEKTDAISIWLGEKLDYSPKKINYLIDQYSGVLGDTFLPMMTPKAESPIDNPILKLGAPFRDRFTTDSVLNNRVTGDFYETLESAEKQAKNKGASKEDKFKSGMLIGYNVEISKLMQEQRDIQTSDLPDSEKYKRNRELKKKINALQEKGLEALEDYSVDGNYAEAGDKRYNYDSEEDTWWEVKPKLPDGSDNWYYTQEQLFHDKLGVSYSDYWNGRLDPEDYDVKSLYAEYGGKRYNFDMDENSWFEIKPKTKDGKDNPYYQREQLAHEKFGVSYEDFWNNREAYSDAVYVAENWGEPFFETVRSAIGVEEFAEIASGMADIKADKDENGEAISGTRKKKMQDYIYGLDIPEIDKHILFKAQYPYTNTYSYEIVKYLDQNDDISYSSFYKILDELGYKYDDEGRITWGWN